MTNFPVTATDTVKPSDPKDEPSREWVNAHPDDPQRFMARTRRYFRLSRMRQTLHYARGLDTDPEDMA